MLRERLCQYDHIIWDWNGTLLADVPHAYQINVEMCERYAVRVPSLSEYRRTFGFPVLNYYRSLGFNVEGEQFLTLNREFLQRYDEVIQEAELFEGTATLLADLREAGKTLAVLSAAEQSHLEGILSRYAIAQHFSYIYGLPDTFGASKLQRGHELLAQAQFDRSKTVLVGDTDHDLEVGRALGIDVLLVADGHQDYERLKDLHHNVLASRFPNN